ncbi:MAG TPA: M28 family metallopeptidase [Blastocatellia bacterium]|nr:M28 family metallopeptidase [Blastocatellia bacterium]
MRWKMFTLVSILTVAVPTIFAFAGMESAVPPARDPQLRAGRPSFNTISAKSLLGEIATLSSDKFEGRAPGTKGEELSINYMADQFKKIGLEPGNTDGTYFQKVPLVGIDANKDSELEFKTPDKDMKLKFAGDYVAWSERVVPESSIHAEMVFVGYGVVAPEYNWDDYKNVDVRGKVLVMLVNDPPVADPRDPTRLDPKVFGGKAMTYYGRWTYKYEIAAERGAAGAILIHETGPAGYPWDVVKGSWSVEQFNLESKDNNMSKVAIEGWITNQKARELFGAAGKDFDELKRAAVSREFKPVPLGARAVLTLHNQIRHIDSHNVIAKLEGSDPKLKDQYIIYTAHWDHLGIGLPNAKGDRIYNGAADNASGCAGLIELARAFKALPNPPRRSILFLSVTAEEKGLLGSKYYAENPVYPLSKTLADINMDVLNLYGRTRDITVIGLGNSTLDDVLRQAAAERGRRLRPDPRPEVGSYYRSDHFSFAKQGVPALDTDSGIDYIGRPSGWGLKKHEEYTANDYHKPSDEIKPDWNLAGAVEDLKLLATVGYRVANKDRYPEWKPGTEFKAKREEMLKGSVNSISE